MPQDFSPAFVDLQPAFGLSARHSGGRAKPSLRLESHEDMFSTGIVGKPLPYNHPLVIDIFEQLESIAVSGDVSLVPSRAAFATVLHKLHNARITTEMTRITP